MNRLAVLSWSAEERAALLRILWEIYHADGCFSKEEQADFETNSAKLFCSRVEMDALGLDDAFRILGQLPGRLDAVTFWIAGALFADGVVEPSEEALIHTLTTKYHLDADRLRSRIQDVQAGLDTALFIWIEAMEAGDQRLIEGFSA